MTRIEAGRGSPLIFARPTAAHPHEAVSLQHHGGQRSIPVLVCVCLSDLVRRNAARRPSVSLRSAGRTSNLDGPRHAARGRH